MKNADRILAVLAQRDGLDDDELSKHLSILRQAVNQECRLLATKGVLIREIDSVKGKLVNRLRSPGGHHRPPPALCVAPAASQDRVSSRMDSDGLLTAQVGGKAFFRVCVIEPLTGTDGAVLPALPQSRYRNIQGLPLHKYGAGPFCKFSIPKKHRRPGVYAIVVDGDLKYIGECTDLVDRYNMGYGNISPRNCFLRGQETNCRINNLIHDAAVIGSEISLWFFPTSDYKTVEVEMRNSLRPPWNRI